MHHAAPTCMEQKAALACPPVCGPACVHRLPGEPRAMLSGLRNLCKGLGRQVILQASLARLQLYLNFFPSDFTCPQFPTSHNNAAESICCLSVRLLISATPVLLSLLLQCEIFRQKCEIPSSESLIPHLRACHEAWEHSWLYLL